jgi:hypothetical protein
MWMVTALLLTSALGQAQDAPRDADGPKFVADVQGLLTEYRVLRNADEAKPAALEKEPVLKYSSDLSGSFVGLVFVWTADNRPEAISTVFKASRSSGKALEHEMLSLSAGKLSARRGDRAVWSPAGPGVEFKPIPGAPKPADTPALRANQMRALSREFTARTSIPSDPRPATELRLLARPIFRHPGPGKETLDGAIFAFVEATDPEILLLIEARRTKEGHEWCFAAARMSALSLIVRHKEEEVWSVPNCWARIRERDAAFTRFFGAIPGSP